MVRRARLKKTGRLEQTKKRLGKLIASETEKSKFDAVIKRAKAKGFSKKKVLESARSLLLQFKMGWMLEPVTTERSKSLARDIATSQRMIAYIDKNW